MTSALTLRSVDGWTLAQAADGALWIRDVELGERGGLSRPRAIRQPIWAAIGAHELRVEGPAAARVLAKVEQGPKAAKSPVVSSAISNGATVWAAFEVIPKGDRGGTQKVIAFYLDRLAAVAMILRLRTSEARRAQAQVLLALGRVFALAERACGQGDLTSSLTLDEARLAALIEGRARALVRGELRTLVREEARAALHEDLRARLTSARPAQWGDFATISYTLDVDGHRRVPAEKPYELELALGWNRGWRDLEAGVVGMRPGDTRSITLVYPQNHPLPSYRGKSAVYHVTMKAVEEPGHAFERKIEDVRNDLAAACLRLRTVELLESGEAEAARGARSALKSFSNCVARSERDRKMRDLQGYARDVCRAAEGALPALQVDLLIALAVQCDEQGVVRGSPTAVARMLGIDPATARSRLVRLRAAGWLTMVKPHHGGAPAVYRLVAPPPLARGAEADPEDPAVH